MNVDGVVKEYFISKDSKHHLNENNVSHFNYMENNFFTSIDFIKLISELEQRFDITFTDAHLQSEQFQKVGGLIDIIKQLRKSSA